MDTRIVVFIGVLALGAAAPSSAASSPWYAGIDLLWSYGDTTDASINAPGTFVGLNTFDPTVLGGTGRVGYDRGRLRIEGEYSWRYRFDFNTRVTGAGGAPITQFKDNVRSQTAMLNLFWDFENRTAFTPYVGAGGGVVWNESVTEHKIFATNTIQNGDNTVVRAAWSLMTGVTWRLGRHWNARLGYRFITLGEIDSGRFPDGLQTKASSLFSHDFLLGARYQF